MRDTFLEHLEAEKRDVERQIAQLKDKLRYVNELLIKRKASQIGAAKGQVVNAKNVNDVFFRHTIRQLLTAARHGLSSSEVYRRLTIEGHHVKYATVRSYLHRMSKQGIVRQTTKGKWELVASADQPIP